MDKFNLHTILRLPTGIFYAQGVKTNVLFFTRGETDKGNTREVWVYALRANMPQFGKRTVLTRKHFTEFEAAFGEDPRGSATSLDERKETGEAGRFRRFTRERVAEGSETSTSPGSGRERRHQRGVTRAGLLAQEAIDELEGHWRSCVGSLMSWARRWRRDASSWVGTDRLGELLPADGLFGSNWVQV